MPPTDREQLDILLEKYPNVIQLIDQLIIQLNRRHITGSYSTAKHTIELLRKVLGTTRWSTASQAMDLVRLLGRVLGAAQPSVLSIGNVIRRVLYIIREEYSNGLKELQQNTKETHFDRRQSLQSILAPSEVDDFTVIMKDLKQSVMEGTGELLDEITNLHENISDQAMEHIHANEVILTYGRSKTVESFLKTAAKKREFRVVVVDSSPSFNGQIMAKELASAGLSVTVISDSAVFAIMARVNKVLISSVAVVANGALITQTGVRNVTLAAKEMSVPVVCIAGLFKLSPLFPHDLDGLNDVVSPCNLLNYEEATEEFMNNVKVINPAYDYVPPEHLDIFLTNIGGYSPSYIYRLLSEYYCPEDYEI